MKIIKPLINQKCQFKGCMEEATCRLFGKNYCRQCYILKLNNWREKNKAKKEDLTFIKCSKCDRRIEKSLANFYQDNYYCQFCIRLFGGLSR